MFSLIQNRNIIFSKTQPRILVIFSLFIFLFVFSTIQASYLHAKGAKLYNDNQQEVRLTGVNWFGFETSNLGPHGLWVRDYHGVLLQIKSLGFNCVRIPFCNSMLRDSAKVKSINFFGEDPFFARDKIELNKELFGLSPLAIMDEIIRYAGEIGLVIVLDCHSREPDGYMNEKLWYTNITSEQQWIDDWVMIANRYKNNPAVTAFDLNNEPHAKSKDGGATWGTDDIKFNWNIAAQKCGNAILAANPNVLIIIEGVEQFDTTMYWWGGNLCGVKKNPIVLSKPEKLVYSPHEYGPEVFQQPWFDDPGFPQNMESIWNSAFGFIIKEKIAPLFVGEFGIKDSKSHDGKAGTWFTTFIKYMADNCLSWTFWCFNPNSGDTGGLLSYDWLTIEQWKVDALKPYCAPLIIKPIAVRPKFSHSIRQSHYLSIQKNIITSRKKFSGSARLDIVDLSGKIASSSPSFPILLKPLASGVYSAVLYENEKAIDIMRFTTY
jgi:aryl-phospho-beta-D-glucosidase BglC (GH1 family)